MTNYILTTGVFIGMIVEENSKILDLDFRDLDSDLKMRVRQHGEKLFPNLSEYEDFPISMNEVRDRYESSWESEETEEDVTLYPLSDSEYTS